MDITEWQAWLEVLRRWKDRFFAIDPQSPLSLQYLGELDQTVEDVVEFLETFGYDPRPLRVEDLEARTGFDECTHIYAPSRTADARVEDLKKRIADLKARMPAHSVNPSMIRELEDLEDELESAKQSTKGAES